MNKEIVLVVFLIQNLELPKGYVANGYVKEAVRQVGFLKSLYRNLVFLVELLGNAPGNAVQLYAVHFGISHILRQQTHEVTNAAAGFQNVAGLEAQIGKPLIHGANYHRRGVERRQGGFPGGGVFVLRKQSFQLAIMGIGFLKELGQAAPAYILRENVLFIRRGQTVFRFQLVQQLYGVNIVIETLNGNANTQIIRGDMIVPAVIRGNSGMESMGTILRMGENGQRGRRLRRARIGHDLTNERRIFQSLRVNKFSVHDPALCQFFPNLLGIDVIEGVFFHIRCGINDLGRMGMVVMNFFRGIFQSVKGAVNISGGPIRHAIMVVIKAVDMELYLNFLTVIRQSLNDLILDAVEGNLGKLFLRKSCQLVKVWVSKFLFRQLFQRTVLSGIHDNAVNVPIQFEIHQVNADLNGDFFIRDGGVGNIDFP